MAFLVSSTKRLYRRLREISYRGMARQASALSQREFRMVKKSGKKQPIKLDFNVPKKHRLNWIKRTINHLPR
jgi:hypothetical protein